jgi:hypothetical protein
MRSSSLWGPCFSRKVPVAVSEVREQLPTAC